ncbi:MAG: hypothetical protein KDA58_12155 [Planctomycetaceae bacterium]|nr:hypothetical protein [Planctomycetaceae bacterium]
MSPVTLSGAGGTTVERIRIIQDHHTATINSAISAFEGWREEWTQTRLILDQLLGRLNTRLQQC